MEQVLLFFMTFQSFAFTIVNYLLTNGVVLDADGVELEPLLTVY